MNELSILWYPVDEVIFKLNKDFVLACFDSLCDDESKRVFYQIIKCRMLLEQPEKNTLSARQYFAISNFMQMNAQEIFLDCGAFVGDSLEKYICEKKGVFQKIIAFEPDVQNFEATKSRIDRLIKEWKLNEDKIELYPYGVGEREQFGFMSRYEANNGLGSKLVSNTEILDKNFMKCRIVALDQFITEPVSFIKADIESYEYRMLQGARTIIKKYRPLLAISIYHNAVDMYEILLLIKSIVPEYKFSIRHHSLDISETVLYAWCD